MRNDGDFGGVVVYRYFLFRCGTREEKDEKGRESHKRILQKENGHRVTVLFPKCTDNNSFGLWISGIDIILARIPAYWLDPQTRGAGSSGPHSLRIRSCGWKKSSTSYFAGELLLGPSEKSSDISAPIGRKTCVFIRKLQVSSCIQSSYVDYRWSKRLFFEYIEVNWSPE